MLILLPQAVAGELEAQGFVDNSVQTCLCDELALEQAIVVSHRQLAAEYKCLVMIAVIYYLFKVVLQITLYFGKRLHDCVL